VTLRQDESCLRDTICVGRLKSAAGPICFVAQSLGILTYRFVRSGSSLPRAAHLDLLATISPAYGSDD